MFLSDQTATQRRWITLSLDFCVSALGKSVGSSPTTTLKYEIVNEAQSDAEGEE